MKTVAAGAGAVAALVLATACSANNSAAGGSAAGEGRWGLVIDGRAIPLSHSDERFVSTCAPQTDGRLGMVWNSLSLNGATDGTVTVFLNGDQTVYSVAARVDTRTGETPWQSYDYGPASQAGAAASVTHHDGGRYRISGTLQGGGPAPAGPTPAANVSALAPPLHAFDLEITCLPKA
jgi:hypothetical protein